MEYNVHYLIFGGSLWAFMLFGLSLHAADVQRRARQAVMALEHYRQPRPIEWLLSALLAFSALAAGLGGVVAWGMGTVGIDLASRFLVLTAAAVAAVALAYVGMFGKNWIHWSRDEFLSSPGATMPRHGQVMVNVALEAERDTGVLRRVSWPAYIAASVPISVVAVLSFATQPAIAVVAALAVLGGGAIVYLVLATLSHPEGDEEW